MKNPLNKIDSIFISLINPTVFMLSSKANRLILLLAFFSTEVNRRKILRRF